MKITIEGEPKEIADFALELQNRLSPEELRLRLDSNQNELEKILKSRITEKQTEVHNE